MSSKHALLLLVLAAGCATDRSQTADAQDVDVHLSQGYSLLYELLREESRVAGLFLLRQPSDETRQLVTRISRVADQGHSQLKTYESQLAGVRFNTADLPPIEVETRELIADQTSKQLLFGSDFEKHLLLSQVEATRYVAALADRVAQREVDEERKTFLKKLAEQMNELHEQVAARLQVFPVAEGAD